MNLLILGGTQFVGRHITEAALAAGHSVSLFTRGQTNPELFPDAERLTGDRDGQVDSLRGRTWDAAIDVNGYVPRVVRQSAELLRDTVERYVYISTISVYADFRTPGMDEDAPLAAVPNTETVTGETYGGLKAGCEAVVRGVYGERCLLIRPSLVAGPYDPTDRFSYWVRRAGQGGNVLLPVGPATPAPFIDARDLAEWMVRAAERHLAGTFNAIDTSPTFGAIWEACAAGTDARPVWKGEGWLLDNGVAPWTDVPLWLPQTLTDEYAGLGTISNARAVTAGLIFRPLSDTVRDTRAWDASRPQEVPLKAGLSPEREAELLAELEMAPRPPILGE